MLYLKLPGLTSLNVENHSLTAIPLTLSLLSSLKGLLVFGNPQKTVRAAVVSQVRSGISWTDGHFAIVEHIHQPDIDM